MTELENKSTAMSRFVLPVLFVITVAVITSLVLNESSIEKQAEVVVYKSPTCGCCNNWVAYLEKNGFTVSTVDNQDMQSVKNREGVPGNLASCHTAIVAGYVVEGHVPVSEIKRMLSERPNIKGITVPEMPVGSPGMEQGNRVDPYDVLAINRDNSTTVYASYR